MHGAVDRVTHDLDFFAQRADDVDALLPAFDAALGGAGLRTERIVANHGFARLAVHAADGDRTDVDLCVDWRLRPAEASAIGPVLTLEELAANKVLAVFSRAEARDFVDLAAVEPRFGLDHLCQLAREKDGGFDRRMFAEMLGRVERLPDDEFGLPAPQLAALRLRVAGWRRSLQPPRRPGFSLDL